MVKTEVLNSLFSASFFTGKFCWKDLRTLVKKKLNLIQQWALKNQPCTACTSKGAASKTRKGSCCLPTLSTSETIAESWIQFYSLKYDKEPDREKSIVERTNTRHQDQLMHFTLSPSNFAFSSTHFFRHFHSWKNPAGTARSVLPNRVGVTMKKRFLIATNKSKQTSSPGLKT